MRIASRLRTANLGPTGTAVLVGVACGLAAGLIGLGLATIGPIYTVGIALGAAAALWMLTDLNVALYAMVVVICVLPFGTLPFEIGLTPTFLDLAMAAVLLVYLFQWMTGRRWGLATTPLHPLMGVFIVITLFSFVAGLRHAGVTASLLRKFAELLLSLGFVFIFVDVVRTVADLRRLALVIVLAGAVAAAAGIALYAMPDDLAERTLIRLAPIGYPDGGVIRYVEDNPALNERAISTSIDPNALGGMLVMVSALAAPQLFARHPLLRWRWLMAALFALLAACLMLTFSRGSMVAFAGALGFIAAVRYRRLLALLIVAALLLVLLPSTQDYVTHFIEGLQGADLATQMRIGEYTDALTAIGRYPLIGVGFAGTPEIDIYLGVANVYLTILQNMGFLGLSVFALLVGGVFIYAARNAAHARAVEGVEATWLGLHAGLAGALIGGVFDHYFFNLEFHHAVTLFWLYIGLALASTRLARQARAV